MFINDSSWKKSEIFFRQLWYSASSNTEGVKCVCVNIWTGTMALTRWAQHLLLGKTWMKWQRACVCVRVHMCVCSKAHFCSPLTFNWKQNIFVLRWISFYQSLNSHCLSLFLILLLFPHFFHVTFVLAPLPLSSIQFVFIYTKMNWNDYI